MHHSGINFLCLANIPEILTKIPACTSCNVHLGMILIAALRAFPFEIIVNLDLTIITADMAVIRLGIKFCILDIVIDKLDNFLQCLQIMSHIRNLHIRNGTAGGNLLELTLK